MVRILIILVGVGVLMSTLTFLMVAHYHGPGAEKESSQPSTAPPPPGPSNAELLRKLTVMEATMGQIKRKVDLDLGKLNGKMDQVSRTMAKVSHTGWTLLSRRWRQSMGTSARRRPLRWAMNRTSTSKPKPSRRCCPKRWSATSPR